MRDAINALSFLGSFGFVVFLGLTFGCAHAPARVSCQDPTSQMPIQLGDSQFVRWSGSSPLPQ